MDVPTYEQTSVISTFVPSIKTEGDEERVALMWLLLGVTLIQTDWSSLSSDWGQMP